MGKLIDHTGKRFGRLTVIKRSYPNSKQGLPNWLCKCECGKDKIIEGHSLKRGLTKSCGCLQRESASNRRLNFGLASMRQVILLYKRHAKEKKIEYKLTEKQFKEITQKDCYYCGAKPNNISRKSSQRNGNYVYNGLDRVDNDKGYTIDNVAPCCKICNYAKRKVTSQEFKDWIKKVHDNFKNKRR